MADGAHDHEHDAPGHGQPDDHDHGDARGGDDDHEHGGGLRAALLDLVRPHSHGVSDRIDTALETSEKGIRALKISLVGLAVTFVLQLVVVVISGSVALLGDTVHNLTDALTAIPLWFAFVLGRRARDDRYTYGYGRAEDLAGVFIVVAIAASAAFAGYESIRRLLDPRPLEHLGWVVAAGLVGFAGNELVAVYRIRVGREIGSAALVADGLHARTDGFTSLAVVAGAIGVGLGFERADPVVGLLITVAILFVLRGAARDVYRRLMDAVDPGLVATTTEVAGAVPGVEGVGAVRLRWIGHDLHAELEAVVDAGATLVAAHAIAEDVRHALLHDVARLTSVTVHVDPCDHEGVDHHDGTAHHR